MGTLGGDGRATVVAGIAAVSFLVFAFFFFQRVDREPTEVGTGVDEISLSEAVAAGDVDLARTLLEGGSEPDEPLVQGFTPLMRAVIRDDTQMIELLVDAGADFEATALEGLTPLHVAAEAGAADAVGRLLEAGADPGVRSHNGMNTLEHAAASGSADVIVIIAATGVNLDARSGIITQGHGYPVDEGSTALGIAARAGNVDAIAALLDAGASIDAPSRTGHTPLLMAIFTGQPPEVISLLLGAGADPTVTAACRTRCSYDEGDALTWARRIGDPDTIPLIAAALGRR
ncbi:MAG: ankyrin repeat domain-containing protein [Actinomycetota bacterium]